MNVVINRRNRRRSSPIYRWAAAVAGCLGLAGATTPVVAPAAAQSTAYRSSETAPAAWKEFALKVQAQLRARLASNDEAVLQFRRRLDERAAAETEPDLITAKVWTAPDGAIKRLEFDGIDGTLAVELRALLANQKVGAPPPADMLQPLRLKFSLARAS